VFEIRIWGGNPCPQPAPCCPIEWMCRVDPSQLETYLVLNARDATPDGGVLQIETRNIVVDEGATAGCLAGPYVTSTLAALFFRPGNLSCCQSCRVHVTKRPMNVPVCLHRRSCSGTSKGVIGVAHSARQFVAVNCPGRRYS
jgi:hypothetical protein